VEDGLGKVIEICELGVLEFLKFAKLPGQKIRLFSNFVRLKPGRSGCD